MEQKYQKLWDLALPYQDKRDDEGHATTVLHFAEELLKTENGNPDVIIPAAILHDIGWSQVPQDESMLIFKRISPEQRVEIQKQHEKYGAELSAEILKSIKYDKVLTEEIVEIISGHDTREGFLSQNDGIVRDADKLWRFSRKGFETDLRRSEVQPPYDRYFEFKAANIDKTGFFYSEKAKQIARNELAARKSELQ